MDDHESHFVILPVHLVILQTKKTLTFIHFERLNM